METTKKDHNYWSMTEGVFNCLIDSERTNTFAKAIKKTIKPGDVVVDAGTGSGILAMLAADAGARAIYAVEIDKKNADFLKTTFKANGYDKKIKLIRGDATKIKLPKKFDVLICEMIATGLIEELQIPVTNNLLRFAKKDRRVLLKKYDSFIDLVSNKDTYYGHQFPIVRYEYPDTKELKSKSLSKKYLYCSVDLSRVIEKVNVNLDVNVKIKQKGTLNAIRISSESTFSDETKFSSSFAYSYPILLPVTAVKVKKGDEFRVQLSYKLCGGFNTLRYSLHKK